jgi:hypothetical protein
MAAARRVSAISIGGADLAQLETIARSRAAPASLVERAAILLAYRSDPSTYAVGDAVGVTHQTVKRRLDRAVRLGAMAVRDDSPRPARLRRSPRMPRRGWSRWPARRPKPCARAWTTRLLARRAREHAAVAGYPCLANIAQGTVCEILTRNDVKPHQVRYYLERRDAALETKMAEVLCVYREVAVLRASKSVAFRCGDHLVRREARHPGDRQLARAQQRAQVLDFLFRNEARLDQPAGHQIGDPMSHRSRR